MNGANVLQTKYDGDGRRIKSIAGSSTTIYHYLDGSWDPSYVNDLSAGVVSDIVFAGIRVGKVQGGVNYYYHLDRLGSVRLVTQSSRVQPFTVKYLPYGASNGTSGAEKFQFTGKQFDVVTGLYYYGYRYYDSQSGRFLSQDPAPADYANPQSFNRYIYALDNPIVHTDPTGLTASLYLSQAEAPRLENMQKLQQYGHFSAGQADALTRAGVTYDQLMMSGLMSGRHALTPSQIMTRLHAAQTASSSFPIRSLPLVISALWRELFLVPCGGARSGC